jgi:hypothetical protein
MNSFLVFLLAWTAALLAVHSSLHCFAVFTFDTGFGAAVLEGFGAAVVARLGAGAAAPVLCARHSATKTFFVLPLA